MTSVAYTTDTITALLTRMASALATPDGTFCLDPFAPGEETLGYTVAFNPDAERYYTGKITHEDISAYLWDHAADVMRPGTRVCGWRHGDSGVAYLYLAHVVESRTEAAHQARKGGHVIFTNLYSRRAVRTGI